MCKKLITHWIKKNRKEANKIYARNTEKDITVDLSPIMLSFFSARFPNQTFHNPRLLNRAN